jgi:hypothetical protein
LSNEGFKIEWRKRLNFSGESLKAEKFHVEEAAANCGMYDAIEDCYILAVVAEKPPVE